MSRVRGARPSLALVAPLACLLLAGVGRAATLDYVYAEPNVGGASGGHVAVRLGDVVYHYQNHASDDTLRMERVHADFFRYAYTVLENRSLEVARVDVDDDTFERLRARFNSRYLIEQANFLAQERLSRDRALLELALARSTGAPAPASPELALRGAGYFYAADGAGARAEEPRLSALRDRFRAERGEGYLAGRTREISQELRGLALSGPRDPTDRPSRDRLPARSPSPSERVLELTLQRLALAVVAEARPLRSARRVAPEGPEFVLGAEERKALRGFGERLEASLLRLPDSQRADWGRPMLVGLARLLVVEESVRTGRLVVLDAFPSAAAVIPARSFAGRGAFLADLRDWSRTELDAARSAAFGGGAVGEGDYNRVEAAANRYEEVRRGLAETRDIRVHAERLVPQGDLVRPDLVSLPEAAVAPLRRALADARRRERAHREALHDVYGYELVTHNCVSEVFQTIEAGLPPDEVEARLGGRVDPRAPLAFVPFVAFDAVKAHWRTSQVVEIPSFRRAHLDEMKARENPVVVELREGNTLTSSIYRRNPRDSFFLFFTDDVVPPRPLYGAFNLLAGVGEALYGVLRLPFDGGRGVVSGAKGAFFSLPELAFVNIRKGTFEYARSAAEAGVPGAGTDVELSAAAPPTTGP